MPSITESVREYLSSIIGPAKQKENRPLGQIIAPVYKDIPSYAKGEKFITEGMRGWAYTAISAICDDVSSNPFVVYSRKGQDWRAIEEHPLLDLLNNPNKFQSREEYLWLTTAYLLATGEAMWILDKPKNPTEMVLFNPSKATVEFNEQEMVSGYTLSLSNGKQQKVPAENVVFLKLPSFKTPFRGTGVMEYVAASIDIDNFVQEYVRVFFFNDATPRGTLQTELEITEEIGKRILRQFTARHQGVKNAHKLAILEKGLKFATIDRSMQEMQLGDLEIRIRDRILSAFRVPKSVIGIIDEVNRANAEASDRNFSKRAVLPRLRFIQAQINQRMVPKFGDARNLWFEFENPVMEDELTKAQVRQINIFSKVRTANEYREEDGLEPLEEAPAENVPADESGKMLRKTLQKRLNKAINRQKVLTSSEKKVEKLEQAIYSKSKEVAENMKKAGRTKMNTGPFSENEIQDWHGKKVDNSDRIENDFAERVWLNQKRQLKDILSQLTGKRRKKTALTIEFDEEEEADILTAISVPYIERSMLAQAALTAALLNIDNTFDTQDNRAKAFMRKWSGKLGESNSQATKDAIARILRDWGADESATIPQLRKTLTEYFDDRTKGETIARTETSRAAGFATETVYKDAGAIGKKWSAALDERTCEYCSQLDGKIVEIGENFIDSGGSFVGRDGGVMQADYGPVPAEPSHPNCRCDIIPVFDFDKMPNDFSFKKFQSELVLLDGKKKELEKKAQELAEKELAHQRKVEAEIAALEELKQNNEPEAEKPASQEAE